MKWEIIHSTSEILDLVNENYNRRVIIQDNGCATYVRPFSSDGPTLWDDMGETMDRYGLTGKCQLMHMCNLDEEKDLLRSANEIARAHFGWRKEFK